MPRSKDFTAKELSLFRKLLDLANSTEFLGEREAAMAAAERIAAARKLGLRDVAYLTIGDVAEELTVSQRVLRQWVSKFKESRPLNRADGRRYYSLNNVDLLKQIKILLLDDGLTIRGAQKALRERASKAANDHAANRAGAWVSADDLRRRDAELTTLREELRTALSQLQARDERHRVEMNALRQELLRDVRSQLQSQDGEVGQLRRDLATANDMLQNLESQLRVRETSPDLEVARQLADLNSKVEQVLVAFQVGAGPDYFRRSTAGQTKPASVRHRAKGLVPGERPQLSLFNA